MELKENE
jgi:hypothetical protein